MAVENEKVSRSDLLKIVKKFFWGLSREVIQSHVYYFTEIPVPFL